MAAVREWAIADGASELVLWVVEGNAAATRLYARHGFAPTGLRQPFPGNPVLAQQQWSCLLRP